MRTVVLTDEGVLELNWVWLPTFIGMDASARRELQTEVARLFEGKQVTDAVLQDAHSFVVGFIKGRYPKVRGLDRYLDALKFIELIR